MLDSVTADSIFAEIMMDETSPAAFLLVEGPDETAIFFGHLEADVVLIACGGKRNVLGAATLAEANEYDNVYGLVDRDFDDLLSVETYPAHVVATETYDLVSDLVLSSSGVLRRALSAHASTAIATIEESSGTNVEDAVFALTSRLAGLRLATLREGYPLILKRYNFALVIDAAFGPKELPMFITGAVCKDPAFKINDDVKQQVDRAFSEVEGRRNTSGGHDLVAASVALLGLAGSQVSNKAVAGTLIAVATCGVLPTLSCLRELAELARTESGVEIWDCLAA